MSPHICDRCRRPIAPEELRYIAKIQVFAAPELLEISPEDLLRTHSEEIDRLLRQCERLSEEELMRDVYVEFQFNLCRACQQAYLADPLGNS
jgi:hypothetical protein